MRVLALPEIQALYDAGRARELVREGLIAYSQGRVQQPPVQHLLFQACEGDCCIKTAWMDGEPVFVVKVASGFYANARHGLSSNQGLNLAFSAHTGAPVALLQDDGWLTITRTGLAGSLAAECLSPPAVQAVGLVGTGAQALAQLEALRGVVAFERVLVWGRSNVAVAAFLRSAEPMGLKIEACTELATLARACRLIVTCTPSRTALIEADWVQPGTHITAVGADAPGKQELDPRLVGRAGTVVADSVAQCLEFGELQHAHRLGLVGPPQVAELGHLLATRQGGRRDADAITLADLTGLAVQDAQITRAILESMSQQAPGHSIV